MRALWVCLAVLFASSAGAQVSALRVSADATRSREEAMLRADEAVRRAARNMAALATASLQAKARAGRIRPGVPVVLPMTVYLTSGGRDLRRSPTRGVGGAITLQFDASGARAFPADYRDFLISVFNAARPTMDTVFGPPAVGGAVRVANFDADIGDREAVAGGYYVPNNGSGQPEIRFPIYTSPEAAAVNFVHTVLLAYYGQNPYAFDPWYEGLTRAAVMRVVRTPGALPAGLDQSLIKNVLAISYDAGAFYDWYNQRDIAAARFIAPNLRDVPLPAGGSVGGLYLLRYRMSGSAWQKVLAQYPTFGARLNAKLQAQPSLAGDVPGLLNAGQQVLVELAGPGATIEGRSFPEWAKRQFILHTESARGPRLVIEPTPITSGLSGSDFGVFLVETHYFRVIGNGDEVLLSGTSFPIFWEGESFLLRIFPSAQEDRMDIAGAYGSVVPNLLDLNAGQPYRAVVDIPVHDQIARGYLPAGAVATAANPTESTLFGTVIGASGNLRVRVSAGGTQVAELPVLNGAFGGQVTHGAFLSTASLLVEVVQTVSGSDSVVLTRRVNKGPGPLALDLRVGGETVFSPSGGLAAGLQTLGIPVEPYSLSIPELLGLPAGQLLAARYDPSRAGYDLFPDIEPFKIGHGYFVRSPAARPLAIEGRTHPRMPVAVALRPGWNMIAAPLMEAVALTRVQVVKASNNPADYPQAAGVDIGLDFFKFTRGPADPASGAPETGTYVAASDFQPGETYFVRVLAPEGVSMLFSPAPSPAPSRAAAVAGSSTRTYSSVALDWRMRVQLSGYGGSSYVFLARSLTATEGFDSREDSALPPSMGGLQAAAVSQTRLYRDTRNRASRTPFKLRFEGLRAGSTYYVRFVMTRGRIARLGIRDLETGAVRNSLVPGLYAFRASGPQREIEVSPQ